MNILINLLLIWNIFFLSKLFHDLGQFTTAKLFRTGVISFSLGYGPPLYQYKSKKSETIYTIKAIPFSTSLKLAERDFELDKGYTLRKFFKWVFIYPSGPAGLLFLSFTVALTMGIYERGPTFILELLAAFVLTIMFLFVPPLLTIVIIIDSLAKGTLCAEWLMDTLHNLNHVELTCYPKSLILVPIAIAGLCFLPLPILDGGKTVKVIIEHMLEYHLGKRGVIIFWICSLPFAYFMLLILDVFFLNRFY